jgi:hypothetical protein
VVKALCVLAIVPLIAGACGAEQAAAGRPLHRSTPTAQAAASTRTQDGCALTIPSSPAFIPPDPYPSQPPELYQAEWYGSADLWTMLGPEGEVWEDLPERGGKFTQKLLWWSEDLSAGEGPTPIPLTARGPSRKERPAASRRAPTSGISW